MKKLRSLGFWFLSLTWGCIMTFIGLCAAAYLVCCKGCYPRYYKDSIYFIVPGYWGGVNFGPIFVVDSYYAAYITGDGVGHEWGHGIQNIILGPLFVVLIAIPSFIRCKYYNWYVGKHKHEPFEYDSIWFEHWATVLGTKYLES